MKKERIIHILYITINFLLFIMPYYLSKKGNHSRNTGAIVLLILAVLWIIINKKLEIDKKLLVTALGYVLFMTISLFFRSDYPNEVIRNYIDITVATLLFIGITQLSIDKKVYKYFPVLISIFLIFPMIRALEGWKSHDFSTTYRIVGDNWPSVFSVEMGLLILVPMIFFFYEKNKFLKLFFSIITSLSYVVIVITQTRAIIVIIPFIFIILCVYKKKRKLLILFSVAVLIVCFIFGGNINKYFQRFSNENNDGKYSTLIRMKIYERGLTLGVKSRFMGIGFRNYPDYSMKTEPYFPEYINYETMSLKKTIAEIPVKSDTLHIWGYILSDHLHNNYLEILVTQGIISFLFYIGFLFYIFKNLIKKLKTTKEENIQYVILGLASFFFICVHGILETNLYMVKVNQILYIILGLALNAYNNRSIQNIKEE